MISVVNEVSPTLFSNYTTPGSSLATIQLSIYTQRAFQLFFPEFFHDPLFFTAAANKVCLGEEAYFPNKEPQFVKRR